MIIPERGGIMGGRGASSGVSYKNKPYGSEYTTLYKSGNIKFVKTNNRGSATAPMETMTKGRVYVTINEKNEPKYINYYDKNNMRYKQIDLSGNSHYIRKTGEILKPPHTHKGYLHDEKGTYHLSPKEQKMVDRVLKTWYNINNKQ